MFTKNGNKEVLRRKSSACLPCGTAVRREEYLAVADMGVSKRDVPTATSRVGALVGAHLAVSDRHESVPDRVGEK